MTLRVDRKLATVLLELAAIVLLALVVAGRPWPTERHDAVVRVLADRSASAPADAVDAAVAQALETVRAVAGPVDVQFVEFAGRAGPIEPHSTNLEQALEGALGGPGAARPAAIVMVSDGNATEGDTRRGLRAAADAGVPVLWRAVSPQATTPRIVEVLAPGAATPGQLVSVAVRLAGTSARPLQLRLSMPEDASRPTAVDVAPGRLGLQSLRWRAGDAGIRLLDVELRDAATAAVLDAWRNAAVIDVEPPATVLYVASGPSALERSLRAGGWRIESITPAGLDARSATLGRYAAVVLDDVPAGAASDATWTALGAAVRDEATGLLVLGGERAFAAGAYRDSALEPLLPVISKPTGLGDSAAVAFLVDKSGSMGASAAGVDRFRLAQRAVIDTAATLTGRDAASLLAFDVEARVLLSLQDAAPFRAAVSRPWAAQPRGGTRLRPALVAALAQLETAEAARRIVVLVTDGFLGEAPDPALLARLDRARIELVALAVGPDADVAALARLVPGERGTVLRVREAAELPSMMRQGLERRRAPIERGRIALQERRPLPFLSHATGEWPAIAAYDVTVAAPGTVVHLGSQRGDPVIASRMAGLGRVVAVTSGLGAWTPGWLHWREWPSLAGGLVGWVQPAGDPMGIAVSVSDRPTVLDINVDVADGGRWDASPEGSVRVRQPSGQVTEQPLVVAGPGRMSTEVDQPADGLYTLAVSTARGSQRVLHLRQPRRELGALHANPEIATWRASGLVRDWSPNEFRAALRSARPAVRSPVRAIALALVLFLLALLVDRGKSVNGKSVSGTESTAGGPAP